MNRVKPEMDAPVEPKPRPKAKAKTKAKPVAMLFDQYGNLQVPEHFKIPGYDIAVIPDFLSYIGSSVKHQDIWDYIMGLEAYDDDEELELTDGWNPKLLRGSHPALNYRGNPIGRHKVWLQTDYDQGLKRYGYTGWQWRVSLAQCRMESIPLINQVTRDINAMFGMEPLNHAIVTVYQNGEDNIGAHSDKNGDFNPNTGFIVLKLGHARRFQFLDNGVVFYDKEVPAGTAVLVSGEANITTKHAVPRDTKCHSESGSIVWRSIGTTFSWATVLRNIKKSMYKRRV